MKSKLILLAAVALTAIGSTACYRTLYTQFSPEDPLSASHPTPGYLPVKKLGWQSFFLWGWVPGTKEIDAEKVCDGTANIQSIHTELTFAEGLVTSLAGYYVNIYSPYDAAIYCSASADR